MRVNSRKIIRLIEEMAPQTLAESWDSPGFQVGSIDAAVDKVMVALEVTEAVVAEAEEKSVDLLVVHHPLLFKPVKTLTDSTPEGQLLRRLIRSDIHVYAAHTNLDSARDGLNDYLAKLLELERTEPLRPMNRDPWLKLAVFVPETHADALRTALGAAGAGALDNYQECSFSVSGTGRFRPGAEARPAVGTAGEMEAVPEERIETIVSRERLGSVMDALHRVHPYEMPAYDLYPVEMPVGREGLGRIGYLNKSVKSQEMAHRLKTVLGDVPVRISGPMDRILRKVAVCTGAGADLMQDAHRSGCDALITGDVKYHEARTAEALGIVLIDAGHFETENLYMSEWAQWLRKRTEEKEYSVSVVLSSSLKSPFQTI